MHRYMMPGGGVVRLAARGVGAADDQAAAVGRGVVGDEPGVDHGDAPLTCPYRRVSAPAAMRGFLTARW